MQRRFIWDEMRLLCGGRQDFLKCFRDVWDMPYVVLPTPTPKPFGRGGIVTSWPVGLPRIVGE
jgi:hypothetical protein